MSEEVKKKEMKAEARVAELESWFAASQESQSELLKRIARADRLAEVADRLNPTATDDEWRAMREALSAYRSLEKKENERDLL